MSTQDIANRLVALCRQGQYAQAVNELYADNATSREVPGVPNEYVEGKDAILEKGKNFFESVQEMHGASAGDPIVAGDHFCCTMGFDATFKEQGRIQMEELAVYKVKGGKVISEQFFYSMPG